MMANIKIIVLLLCAAVLPNVYGLGRIVGGIETTIELRPYQASLQYQELGPQHSCGASIISDKFLLSAAHCNPGTNIALMYARLGSTRYSSGGVRLKVSKFIPHPNFVSNILDYDFAIVGFENGVTIPLGPNIAIIPLTNGSDPIDGSVMVVSGWGVTSESSSSSSPVLREANIPVVNRGVCKQTYSFLTDRQLCLGGTAQGGLSACFGDSGGPGVQDGVQYVLVSGGNSCEAPNVPGIYARISFVRDWIREQTGV